MMAAVQPFISGGVAKTLNLSNETTVEDTKRAYLMAWRYGLKAVMIVRQGARLSDPLPVQAEILDPAESEFETVLAASAPSGANGRILVIDEDNAQPAFAGGETELRDVQEGQWT